MSTVSETAVTARATTTEMPEALRTLAVEYGVPDPDTWWRRMQVPMGGDIRSDLLRRCIYTDAWTEPMPTDWRTHINKTQRRVLVALEVGAGGWSKAHANAAIRRGVTDALRQYEARVRAQGGNPLVEVLDRLYRCVSWNLVVQDLIAMYGNGQAAAPKEDRR